MKMIARIERRQQSFAMLRIAGNLVEIDHCIEMAGSSDPFIDGLPIRFARWARMIVARSHKGHFTTKT
jgi:hypothetical protein